MAGAQSSGRTLTLNIFLGLFLKLLGFFVVLYGFAEVDPVKARKAEISIHERFNINISLVPDIRGDSHENISIVQTKGRSYHAIEQEMKSQVDLLSTDYVVSSNTLILRLPAEVALPIDGGSAKSPDLPRILRDTLESQVGKDSHFALEVVTIGNDDAALIRGASIFAEKMLGAGFNRKWLTIGYQESSSKPIIEFRIRQVAS